MLFSVDRVIVAMSQYWKFRGEGARIIVESLKGADPR
jgi:hypothetical protein